MWMLIFFQIKKKINHFEFLANDKSFLLLPKIKIVEDWLADIENSIEKNGDFNCKERWIDLLSSILKAIRFILNF